jgi:aspartyl-tRNA(Asn)/glutamyl-tRNA(Gln) amidotransferase subunit C
MDVLSNVKTEDGVEESLAVRATPLRPDAGPQIPLEWPRESFAPRMQDDFFLVPRLSTHEDPETS